MTRRRLAALLRRRRRARCWCGVYTTDLPAHQAACHRPPERTQHEAMEEQR